MKEASDRSDERDVSMDGPSRSLVIVGVLFALAVISAACTRGGDSGDVGGHGRSTLTGDDRDAAIQSALQDLIEIRQPPADLSHFVTNVVRSFGAETVVAYGPYVDGPAVVRTSQEAQLGRSDLRGLLAQAVEATPHISDQVDRALEFFDRFASDEELSSRVPNPTLQGAVAYLSVLSGPSSVFSEGSGTTWLYPTAEPVPGVSSESQAELARTFRPRDLVGELVFEIRPTPTDRLFASINPTYRFDDPRTTFARATMLGVQCDFFTQGCRLAREILAQVRYLDFVLADPTLALNQQRSSRELNTQLMRLVNSAVEGRPAPQLAPSAALGLFPDADELSLTRESLGLECQGPDERSVDCWEALHVNATTEWEAQAAWYEARQWSLDRTTPASIGGQRPFAEILGVDGSIGPVGPDSFGDLDAAIESLVTPERNVAFRYIVGLLRAADVERVAATHQLGALDISDHLETEAGVPSLEQIDELRDSAPNTFDDARFVGGDLGSASAVYNTTFVAREDGYAITLARYESADLAPGDTVRSDDGITELRHPDTSVTRSFGSTELRIPDDSTGPEPRVEASGTGGIWHHRPLSSPGPPVVIAFGGSEVKSEGGALAIECEPDGSCLVVVVDGTATLELGDGETRRLEVLDAIELDASGLVLDNRRLSYADLGGSAWIRFFAEEDGLADLQARVGPSLSGRFRGSLAVIEEENVDGLEVGDTSQEIDLGVVIECKSLLNCGYDVFISGAEITAASFSFAESSAVIDYEFTVSKDDPDCEWLWASRLSISPTDEAATSLRGSLAASTRVISGDQCSNGTYEADGTLDRVG